MLLLAAAIVAVGAGCGGGSKTGDAGPSSLKGIKDMASATLAIEKAGYVIYLAG